MVPPFEIISDRGKSFLAERNRLVERREQDSHLATTPYHPQTNGMVERNARYARSWLLTTLTNESRDRWDEFLPQTLLASSDSDSCCNGIFSVLLDVWYSILVFRMMKLRQDLPWRLWMTLSKWRRTPNSLLETWRKLGKHGLLLMFGPSTGRSNAEA
ncbi:hypothetical protein BASA81_016445 [Batrachochytrium salamandrivorans]|nr:hypothetical protein BASA81_016445 [Batrachochytrium salamandrivorans]